VKKLLKTAARPSERRVTGGDALRAAGPISNELAKEAAPVRFGSVTIPSSMVPPRPPFIRVSLVRSLYPPPSGYHADRFVLIVSVSQQQLSLFDVIRHRAGLRWTTLD